MSDPGCINMRTTTAITLGGKAFEKGDVIIMGGFSKDPPCVTCRHWNHVQGSTCGLCTSDTPPIKAEGSLYTDCQASRPCWEGMP